MSEPTDTPASREELIASIAAMPLAAVVTDARRADNPIVAANAAFCRLTGYAEAEIVGRNCRFLAGEGTDPAARKLLRDAVREARPALAELLNYRKDGSPFRNAVMIAPLLDEGGRLVYCLGTQMEVGAEESPLLFRQQRARACVAALTPRQRQVLEGMIGGYRNKQIAGHLGIEEKTVKMHRAALIERLGVGSSAEAVRQGVEAGLGTDGPA
jgi:PAS domain S-box-containing protein